MISVSAELPGSTDFFMIIFPPDGFVTQTDLKRLENVVESTETFTGDRGLMEWRLFFEPKKTGLENEPCYEPFFFLCLLFPLPLELC